MIAVVDAISLAKIERCLLIIVKKAKFLQKFVSFVLKSKRFIKIWAVSCEDKVFRQNTGKHARNKYTLGR